MSFFTKTITRFAKPFLIGFLLLLIALSPFGFHEANASGFCNMAVIGNVCQAFSSVFADILMIPMVISAWILWLAGVFLNTVLTYTVVELSDHISGISGINIAWATIRDLSNMVFIFVLLYVAIGTILGISKSDWKNTLKNIVIAAVLINFSLLGTKIIIDASNIFTLGIYKQIVPDSYTLGGGGMSNVIMKPLGLSTLYNPIGIIQSGASTSEAYGGSLTKIAITSIGSSIFMFTTAGVFFGVASMFVIRYITFIFLLIFSPVAVMSSVLPQLKKNQSTWTSQLSGQATFAPLFMILLWVVLTIINSPGFLCTATGGTAALSGLVASTMTASSVKPGVCTETGLLLNFVIVTAFMSAILGIAQKASNQSGEGVQKLVASVLGGGAGVAGWAGRNTVGRTSRSFAESESLKDRASKGGAFGFAARTALRSTNNLAGRTFDARSGKTFLGQDIKNLNLGGKAGGKDGYDGAAKEYAKKQTEFSKKLGPSDEAKEAAKKAVDSAKKEDPGKIRLTVERQLRNAEKTRAEKEHAQASARFAYARTLNLDENSGEYKKYESDLEEKEKALEVARNKASMNDAEMAREVKNIKIAEAEERSNRTSGINDKDMKKQVIERIKRERNVKTDAEATKIINDEEISTKEVIGVGNVRKESYATKLDTGRKGWKRIIPDTDRVLLFGKMKKKNLDAARSIRKEMKGKSAAEEVLEKLKGEVKKEADANQPAPADPAPEATPAPKP